ncbi:MAG: cyclic nucleotide-binding domain-containing protein, partial [Anaerolineae bacterium]|nr:cyclic nucleotide-binding domain-containing protein [Anaerolineae bacterium]
TQPIARLSGNQFFGEVELLGASTAMATVRAGQTPVELGLLSREEFHALMQDSPATAALLRDVAAARMQENLARDHVEAVR